MLAPTLLSVIAILTFSGVLAYACYTDFREMRITNKTCLVGAGAFAFYAVSLMLLGKYSVVVAGVVVAAAVFVVTAFMNAKKLLGGGDVKLLTVLALWTGTQHFADTFFIVAVCGGLMAVAVYVKMQMAGPTVTPDGQDAGSALDQRPIPYGPGITIAGLVLCSELILNGFS